VINFGCWQHLIQFVMLLCGVLAGLWHWQGRIHQCTSCSTYSRWCWLVENGGPVLLRWSV